MFLQSQPDHHPAGGSVSPEAVLPTRISSDPGQPEMDTCKSVIFCWILLVCFSPAEYADQKTITAESGQNVTLTCRAPNNNIIVVLEWSRADLEPDYVLLYRDEQFVPDNQHPSFKNRVDLQDKQMKDGDVSLILKNVTSADNGTYECRVFVRGANHRKRAHLKTKPITTIRLNVSSPAGQTGGHTEDGSVGLIVGLSVFALLLVAAVVGFLIYRKHKQQQNKDSYQPPRAEQQPV
ncbi:hepatitis A virus cellular receptor 2 homolog isoform X2 [Simochromis diagramma]|uniref:hepatitis A virus cellular receptor 2 homolog isoform X2 n=1 Tax=Simochromis diagramma TaxID=43689 RepID=UPI001A7EA952|nr:hepatitis A virus cellular receptor 2 homolog isoform X2 [Simochromis diagramma]